MVYALIYKSGMFLGFFSSKKIMRMVIETIIKSDYERDGYYGNYNFRYVEFKMNEPWLYNIGEEDKKSEGTALLSLSTMHDEYFTHKVQTDWSTGKIISMDSDKTTNC